MVRALSTPAQRVVADYPGVNFLAGRATTYWAAGISNGSAANGQVRGEALIAEMEAQDVAMVIIDTSTWAHQFRGMKGYDAFRAYVQSHFSLIDRIVRGWEVLEVYARRDTMPYKPSVLYSEGPELTGVRVDDAPLPGRDLGVALRWSGAIKMPRSYSVSLRIIDGAGQRWAETSDEVVERYPSPLSTKKWALGQVVLQEFAVPLPAGMPSGLYYLTLQVSEKSDAKRRWPEASSEPVLASGEVLVAPVRVLAPSPGG
jgi:hypothetical protein